MRFQARHYKKKLMNEWEVLKMGIIPKLTGAGLADYFALAAGLSVGFALLSAPAKAVEDAIRKN